MGEPRPQWDACDRCSVGVMDSLNPHAAGRCRCSCHKDAADGDPDDVTPGGSP